MKTLALTLVLLLVAGVVAFAADIDGKWKSERKMERNGETVTITQVFELKADGAKLTGKVNMTGPFGEREMAISDGKVDGAKFSFTTTFDGPNGPMVSKYEGTVEGDALKGTATRGERTNPFEAKKQ